MCGCLRNKHNLTSGLTLCRLCVQPRRREPDHFSNVLVLVAGVLSNTSASTHDSLRSYCYSVFFFTLSHISSFLHLQLDVVICSPNRCYSDRTISSCHRSSTPKPTISPDPALLGNVQTSTILHKHHDTSTDGPNIGKVGGNGAVAIMDGICISELYTGRYDASAAGADG
jgi:hypothetical protein